MKRRIFSVLTALALCLSLLPATALAEEGDPAPQADPDGSVANPWSCGDGVTAVLDGETLTFSYSGTGTGEMTNYNNTPEESLPPWYGSRTSIKKVVINTGVTSIGNNAFWRYPGNPAYLLDSVKISDSVTSIGEYAFRNSMLTSIEIPGNVKTIKNSAFNGCTALTSVTMADGVNSIGEYAFSGCKALNAVEIPDSVTSIGSYAFSGCVSLSTIKIPGNIRSIASSVFYGCTALSTVEIPGNVTSIGNDSFKNCTALRTVKIPSSVTYIGSNAFSSCEKVEVYYAGTLEEWKKLNGSDRCGTSNVFGAPHTVTVEGGAAGSTGAGSWNEGKTVTVYAGAKAGYAFDMWTATGVTLENTASQTVSFKMPATDVTLTATWRELEETDYVAQVTQNGATSSYATLEDAWKSLPAGESTVTLLKSAEISEPLVVDRGKTVTVEMRGGVTLTASAKDCFQVQGGSLTLASGTVTESGSGKSLVYAASGTLRVTGGSYSSAGNGFWIDNGVDVQLTGGSFTASDKLLRYEGKKASEMLPVGYALSDGSGKIPISQLNVEQFPGGGPTFTVGLCGHTDADLACTTNGNGTHSVKCRYCRYAQDSAPHTYENSQCPGCQVLIMAQVETDGGTSYFETIEAAWASLPDGKSTVTLLENAAISETLSVGENKNVTVKMGDGVTLTAGEQNCFKVVSGGTLILTESCDIRKTGRGNSFVDIPAGTLIIRGGTYTNEASNGNGVWAGDSATVQIFGGTFTVANNKLLLRYESKPVSGMLASGYLLFDKNDNQVSSDKLSGSQLAVTSDLGTPPFTVKKGIPLDNAEVTLTGDFTYNGQEQIPTVGVLMNGSQLAEEYYSVAYVDAEGTEVAPKDAGTYKLRLTGKKPPYVGTVTLESPVLVIKKATPTIEWGENVEEHWEYTGEPVAPSLTPTVTVTLADGAEYDGDPVTYSYAVEAAGPYTPGLPTDAGTYYVKAAVPQQKNYTAAETAGTLKLVITKAAAEITTAPTAVNPAYNGKPQALVTAAEATFGEVQYSLTGEDGSWSKEIPTGKNAGEYTVWYKVDETDNYKGVAAASVKAEIGKATVTVGAASQNLPVKNNLEKTYTLDLKPFLPVLPQGQEYGKLTYELTEDGVDIQDANYIDAGTVKLEGTVLTVPVNKVDKTDEGSVAVITVTIQSDNFQDIRLTVSVTATNKTPLIITGVTAQGWTYDGTVHPGYTGTPRAEGYTGEFQVTYFTEGKDRKGAGTFRVEFTPKDPGYEGSLELPYTVEQAQVTVKADDKTATVGDAKPELTWRVVSGLADGEVLEKDPVPACTADMSKAGTYPIAVSGGAVPDGGNYKAEIIYQPGTLTVKEKPAPPKPVDPKPPVDPDELEVKLEVKEGFTEVPPALRALEHLNTPEKLTQVMRTAVTRTGVPSGNTAVYDVSLMVSNDGGRTWAPATAANFPSGGLTVTLPYPAGTDSTYRFTVVHMFTSAAFDKIPGDTESPAVTNTEQGLRFTVRGLSPISVGWKAKTTGTGGSSSGGSSSSGGGSRPMSSVTVERAEHGKVTSDRSSAGSGSPVTLTVQPDKGYRLESLTVADSRGNKLRLTAQGGGKYAFTMSAGAVTVKAVFAPLAEDADCPSRAFADLESGAWYHEAVDFVLRNGLMGGYGNGLFKPDRTLTRAQFAQILYNKEGRPAAAGGAPFTDVPDGAWCAPAIAWAAERGIAGGYGGGLFGPDDAITREQLAVMLWRYAGSPAAPDGGLAFVDAEQIGTHAREALGWATRTGVMNGKGGGVLDPKGPATRAQTAQMLKNFLENG